MGTRGINARSTTGNMITSLGRRETHILTDATEVRCDAVSRAWIPALVAALHSAEEELSRGQERRNGDVKRPHLPAGAGDTD